MRSLNSTQRVIKRFLYQGIIPTFRRLSKEIVTRLRFIMKPSEGFILIKIQPSHFFLHQFVFFIGVQEIPILLEGLKISPEEILIE